MNKLQIELRAELSLSPQVDAEIATLLEDTFGPNSGYDGRSFQNQRHHLRILGREAGRLVGHAALCFRNVRNGDALVPIIGVAEVATAPDLAGQGIASALLKKTISVAEGTQAAFVMLFGDHPIYERHGFFGVTNRLTYTDIVAAKSEQIINAIHPDLKLLPLADFAWDEAADVDLLGHIF